MMIPEDDLEWFEWAEATDFQQACLFGWTIPEIDLRTKDFSRCDLEDVTFTKTDLRDTNWNLAKLKNVVFEECDLCDADFQSVEAANIRFDNCKMDGILLNTSSFERLEMINCDGRMIADFIDAEKAEFIECDFGDSSFDGSNMEGASFQKCNLALCDFTRAVLENVKFLQCVLTDSKISGAKNLNWINYAGSIIDPFGIREPSQDAHPRQMQMSGVIGGKVQPSSLGIYQAPARIAVLTCSDENELQQQIFSE